MLALIVTSPLVKNPRLEGRESFVVVLKLKRLLSIPENSG
jgi:hypothetical protein